MSEPVVLIADLFPGAITDTRTGTRPEGIPKGVKLHIILSTTRIAVAWEAGTIDGQRQLGTWFTDVTEEETAEADHRGGTVGNYVIQRAGGCSCGAALKRWNPYAGRPMTQVARYTTSKTYGLPQSYTRS